MKQLFAMGRRSLCMAFAGIFLGAASLSTATAQSAEPSVESILPRWVASWSAPPMGQGSTFGDSRSFDNQTVRQIVHISAGGTRMRVTLSNEYGEGTLIVGSANVALQASASAIVPSTNRALTFRGSPSVVIPVGATAVSDPVNLSVPSNANLAISLYVPQNTGMATFHPNGNQTVYVSTAGDFSAATDLPLEPVADPTKRPTSRYWLTFVEVLPTRRIGALAVFGDSLSEGATTTLNANRRVTDVLSRWFNPPIGAPRLALINQSSGCGRLLWDFCGPKGLSRFDREVLNASGVNQVVLELGYGDIIFPTAVGDPTQLVSAEQIIDGIRQLARRAHMRGLRVVCATLLPNGSSPIPGVYTPENEAKRQAVNRWIRTTREFDAVADYDLLLRDPSDPTRLLPAYDADGIHPNDAGHEALARAIALSLL
jgi:lysophospholipase L1-like esterase